MKTFTIHFTAALFTFLLTQIIPGFFQLDFVTMIGTALMIQVIACALLEWNFKKEFQPDVPIEWNNKWFS